MIKENKFKKYEKLILLISILIILFIFGVIINLLFINGCCESSKPIINNLLKVQVSETWDKNYTPEACTNPVTFTKSNQMLSTEEIIKDTGLEPNQVYFDNPEKINDFYVNGLKFLKYTATTSKKVIVCIICADNKNSLISAIQTNKREGDNFNSLISNDLPNDETLCVVYPRQSNNS